MRQDEHLEAHPILRVQHVETFPWAGLLISRNCLRGGLIPARFILLSSEKGIIGCHGNKGRRTAVYKDGTGRRAARAPFDSGVPSPFLPGRIDPGESKDEQATKQGRGGNLPGKTKDEL